MLKLGHLWKNFIFFCFFRHKLSFQYLILSWKGSVWVLKAQLVTLICYVTTSKGTSVTCIWDTYVTYTWYAVFCVNLLPQFWIKCTNCNNVTTFEINCCLIYYKLATEKYSHYITGMLVNVKWVGLGPIILHPKSKQWL